MAYINTRRYGEAIYWIDRTEMLLDKYREYPDALLSYFDEYQGKIEIMRAVALQGLKREDDAASSYQAYLETEYSKTPNGHVNANDYLMAAQRYQEAADNYKYLDQVFQNMGMSASTLDNIQLYLLPKYHSNAKSGRADSARVSAQRILGVLDDAIVGQKNSATAELATIYDTQGKETEIARQQAEMSKLRFWWTAALMVMVVTFFVVYTLLKRKSTHRLAAAHEQLKVAYDQLEEATAHRERIESELRIARDIQMSMVPNIFPEREGLDIHALIEPAKEVGGDLYGYLLLGDELYFCLGDVSGKGVPASLFMAQATRLFRTLATQHMMPAEIATRMNSALSEGNEQGMFVTMFIGLVHLEKGSIDYCNAGHNPPFMGDEEGGDFLEMLPNAPIGLWPDLEFSGEHMDDIKGRLLVIYTDGLNEAENQKQEQFGEDRLLEILKTMTHAKAKDVVETLREKVQQHRNGAEPNDDLTIMSLRIG
jgi:serine phosphatase RsbU (regulator of sigma subunit)